MELQALFHSLVSGSPTRNMPATREDRRMKKPMYQYAAKVVRVVDGDTAHLMVDLGFSILHKVIARLARINTPEKHQPRYQEATDHLRMLLAEGEAVHLHVVQKDRYGRYVAEITKADGTNPSDLMLESQLARTYKD